MSKVQKYDHRLCIMVEDDLYEKLLEVSEEKRQSLAQTVRNILWAHFDEERDTTPLTQQDDHG